MKKTFTLLIVCLSLIDIFAQAPQKLSYQCVVRNSAGALVTNQGTGVKISIIQGTPAGALVYQEIFNPNPVTNTNGLLVLEIGTGIPISGLFSAVNWSGGPFFLKTEIDPTGGTSYTITGTSQILSVPYALLSKSTEGIPDNLVTTTKIAGNAVTVAKLPAGATGSTYLRGDGTWQVPPGTNNPSGATGNIQYNYGGSFAGSANLHWDWINFRLGVGTNTPDSRVQIKANSSLTYPHLKLTETSAGYTRINFQNGTGSTFWAIAAMNSDINANELFNIYNSVSGNAISISGTGNVSIGAEPVSTRRLYVPEPGNAYAAYFTNEGATSTAFMKNSGTGPTLKLSSSSTYYTLYAENTGTGQAANFDGSIYVSGGNSSEINRSQTSTANIVPICYGSINADGTKNSSASTTNFTVTKITEGIYDIKITGESYSKATHTAIISLDEKGFVYTTKTEDGELRVATYNTSGSYADKEFSFVVLKP